MENVLLTSYDSWNEFALKATFICWGLGLIGLLGYLIRLGMTGEYKAKYDFITIYETKVFFIASLFIYAGIGFFANSYVKELTPIWIFVRIFSTVSMLTIAAVSTDSLLKFYYPFFIGKRLKKLRYTPRISPKTGKPMKLLSEEDEDVYLDEGMQAEESMFSKDYDVWKDEETGHIKIEEYSGHLFAIECPKCHYQTFTVARREPIEGENGGLVKHYLCSYCGHKATEEIHNSSPSSNR